MIKSSTLVALEQKFKNDPSSQEAGRSQKLLPQDHRALISKLVESCFPTDYILPQEKIQNEKLKTDIAAVSGFVVAKGWITASAEAGHLPTCRLGMAGSRVVICARSLPLLDFLTKATGSKCDMAKCYQWLKSATPQAAKSFADAYESKVVLMHGTVGPETCPSCHRDGCFMSVSAAPTSSEFVANFCH